ncbi:MAG: hypothetical protein WD079_02265, partial [Phycisphaeraceae bacterium]
SFMADLAGILHEDGLHQEALEMADRAISADRSDMAGLLKRSEILADMGKAEEAKSALEDAAAIDENSPELFTSRARVNRSLGDRAGALEAADELVSLQGTRGNSDDLSNLNQSLELYEQMVNDWEEENADRWQRNLEKLGRLARHGRAEGEIPDMETSEAEGFDEESIPLLNFNGGTAGEAEEEPEDLKEPDEIEDEYYLPEGGGSGGGGGSSAGGGGSDAATAGFGADESGPDQGDFRDLVDEKDEMPFPEHEEAADPFGGRGSAEEEPDDDTSEDFGGAESDSSQETTPVPTQPPPQPEPSVPPVAPEEEAEPEVEAEPDQGTAQDDEEELPPEVDSESPIVAESEPAAQVDQDAESASEPEPEFEPELEPGAEAEAAPEPELEPEPEAAPEAAPEPELEPEPEAAPEAAP